MPPATRVAPTSVPLEPRRWTFKHTAAAVVVAALVVMWVYALFFAPKRNANDLDDNQWAARAEAICVPRLAAVSALAPANSAKTPQERGKVLVEANAELAAMVSELKGLASPASARDRDLTGLWLTSWTQFIGDREAHAARLLEGKDVRFGVEINANRGPVNANIDYFADVNAMASCGDPGDV
jgi:hypothetical protein